MIYSIVISWNPTSEQYFMTIMDIDKNPPIKTHHADSILEILDILHLKVKDETKCTS